MKEVFVIVGKEPLPGFAKTRLSERFSPEEAAEFCLAFTQDLLRRAKEHNPYPLHLLGYPQTPSCEKFFKNIAPWANFSFQRGDNFFERLSSLGEQFEGSWIYLTGTDVPDFPFDMLKEVRPSGNDCFLGPDEDGGFYFMAAPSKAFSVFLKMNSQSEGESVYQKLLNLLQSERYDVKELKSWSDIDTALDLANCLKRNSFDELPYTYKTYKKIIERK
jgi:uncharacterized protein